MEKKGFQKSKKNNWYKMKLFVFVVAYQFGPNWKVVRRMPGLTTKGTLTYASAEEACDAANALIERTLNVWHRKGHVEWEERGEYKIAAVYEPKRDAWFPFIDGPHADYNWDEDQEAYASAEECLEDLRRQADDIWEGVCDGISHSWNEGEYAQGDAALEALRREQERQQPLEYYGITAKA